MANEFKLAEKVAKSFARASEELKFRYQIGASLPDGLLASDCFALVSDFGDGGGTVVGLAFPVDYETSVKLVEVASSLGLHYSFINAERYQSFDRALFIETLLEWGYSGAKETGPGWLG